MSEDPYTVLETSLTNLLTNGQSDPWSLLMVQTLIWSFRRWAIHHLTTEAVGALHEYMWDSYLDLVQRFAPEGLREFGTVWLSPANLGSRVDFLEELNGFFTEVVEQLDSAIQRGDEEAQNCLAIFLDDTMTQILDGWLAPKPQYKIYPGAEDTIDSFPPGRIFIIMQSILESYARSPVAAPSAPVQEEPVPADAAAAAVSVPEPEPTSEPTPEPTSEPPAAPSLPTVAAALAHRKKTLKLRKTAHPDAAAKTRKHRP